MTSGSSRTSSVPPVLRLMSAPAAELRTVLYLRPLVPAATTRRAMERARHWPGTRTPRCSAFYRDQIAAYYRASGLPEPYGDTARRRSCGSTREPLLTAFGASRPVRKTSAR